MVRFLFGNIFKGLIFGEKKCRIMIVHKNIRRNEREQARERHTEHIISSIS